MRIADAGSVAVFCPTSNLFLGSGLFDYQRYRTRPKPLRIATATDVGGGTSYSMLRTLDEGYKVIALQRREAQPARLLLADDARQCRGAVARRTGSARWSRARTPTSWCSTRARRRPWRLRMETVETLAEELFLLQTLGDDRAVAEVYVAGRPAKSTLGSSIN